MLIPETPKTEKRKTARGSLAEYANPDLREQEKTAWEKAVKEKYDNERYVRVLNSMAGL